MVFGRIPVDKPERSVKIPSTIISREAVLDIGLALTFADKQTSCLEPPVKPSEPETA